jgi:carboxypeptidase C (cathepsin A)
MDDETNFFFENPYSWNREVNMLYIEMPGGVGYSVCGETNRCAYTDETTADDNLAAMLNFFELYPEYKTHDLYISGESYAGVYVPFLAHRMH